MPAPTQPRLAAVMFTDIVGYSAIAHRSDRLGLEIVEEYLRLARPCFEKHAGRLVKSTGDGSLVEFASASAALLCAVHLQQAVRERNRRSGDLRKLEIRIGVHLGEVFDHEGDILGDGVNIAARLQAIAPAGETCFSRQVYDQVRQNFKYPLRVLGWRRLKNIANPVKVFTLSLENTARLGGGSRLLQARRWLNRRILRPLSPGKPALGVLLVLATLAGWIGFSGRYHRHDPKRVAVLPFANISHSPEDEYLGEGMTEELISTLARNDKLRVLSRGSMAEFQKKRHSPREIAERTRAGTLVTGSVHRSGNRLRIAVQLVDLGTEEIKWSEQYEGELETVFEIQKSISESVAQHLSVTVPLQDRAPASAAAPVREAVKAGPDRRAYLEYLHGLHQLGLWSEPSLRKSLVHFRKVVEIDPGFAKGYIGLATAYGMLELQGYLSPNEAAAEIQRAADRAFALDNHSAAALSARGAKRIFFDYDFSSGERDFRQSIELAPHDATARHWFSSALVAAGKFDSARDQIQVALEIDPISAQFHNAAADIEYYANNLGRARALYRRVLTLNPYFVPAYRSLAHCLLRQGDGAGAVTLLSRAVEITQGSIPYQAALAYVLGKMGKGAEARKILARILELAANGRYVSPYDLAQIHMGLGETDAALWQLEQGAAERSFNLVYLRVDPVFLPLRGSSRFTQLLKAIYEI